MKKHPYPLHAIADPRYVTPSCLIPLKSYIGGVYNHCILSLLELSYVDLASADLTDESLRHGKLSFPSLFISNSTRRTRSLESSNAVHEPSRDSLSCTLSSISQVICKLTLRSRWNGSKDILPCFLYIRTQYCKRRSVYDT